MLASYYKRLVTSSSTIKICLNCKSYSKAAVTATSIGKRKAREELTTEKTEVPSEYKEYFGKSKNSLLELFPKRLFRKIQKPAEIFYLVGNSMYSFMQLQISLLNA